jgi:hypothetical protein
MTEQEQIEIEEYIASLKLGQFHEWSAADIYHAYLAGKRNMPVIELPKRELDDCKMFGEFRDGMEEGYRICHIIITGNLESAGTQYTIKGE